MELPPSWLPPRYPYISTPADLPAKEIEAVAVLEWNLKAIEAHAAEFAQCVALFNVAAQNSNNGRLWGDWQFLACNQAIVAAYNYRMAMDGAVDWHRTCPSLVKLVGNSEQEAAKAKFRAHFPSTKELRQTILHSAEKHSNQERTDINSLTGPIDFGGVTFGGGTILIGGGVIMGQRYSASWAGKMHELDMSEIAVAVLMGITREFFAPFERLAETLMQQQQQQ